METRVRFGNHTYILMPDMLGRGETARVFPAYLEGKDPSQANWAIKLARDQRHNVYIEREYETLAQLHNVTSSPALPIVKMGESTDGRKALIMEPLLRQSLLAVFEGIDEPIDREKLALRAAKQYADLLQVMVNSNISCRDRKLGDLWWFGEPESGQLIVTDWNVVDDTANQVVDIRRFGLLWFELVVGKQMLRDFQPKREDFERFQDRVSYGLWHIIGRALGSSMRFQFRTVQELAASLDTLASYYARQPQTLVDYAQADLKEAQTNQDRSKADLAWIQFDIAQRLGAGDQTIGIEQARLWAQDTLTQAVPGLLEMLSSSNFSEVSLQLQQLKDKAQGPQELGDIERLELGFDFLNGTMSSWQKAEPAKELAQASREFAELQDLLVKSVLCPLIERNGPLAKDGLQKIEQLLRLQHGEETWSLSSLEHEATFWEFYQDALMGLDESPNSAIEAMEKAKRTRARISHWPALYEPTIGDIDQLIELAESNRRSAILAGEAAKQIREKEADVFSSALREDIAKRRWGEATAELVAVLEQNPRSDKLKGILRQTLGELLQQRAKLADGRASPGRLAERVKIIEALLQVPPDMALGLLDEQQLRRELAHVHELEKRVSLDQRELFRTPAQVLESALEGGYELFDDDALSVVVLKAVHDFGRWDADQFSEGIDQLKRQAERFKDMTDVFRERKKEMEEILSLFEVWQKESPAKTRTFFANTLRLYLTTALAQVKKGARADRSLERVERLLEFVSTLQLLPPNEYDVHENLYQHLVEMQGSKQEPEDGRARQPSPSITEEQLEGWFKEYKFEDCRTNLSKLPSEEQRNEWATRIRHATQLRDLVQKGAPQLDGKYFKKKNNVRVCASALDTFRRAASESDPMAFGLYQEQIQILYKETWQRLARLDKKVAGRFDPSIRDLKSSLSV